MKNRKISIKEIAIKAATRKKEIMASLAKGIKPDNLSNEQYNQSNVSMR